MRIVARIWGVEHTEIDGQSKEDREANIEADKGEPLKQGTLLTTVRRRMHTINTMLHRRR